MNETNKERAVVDTLFDVGETWAAHGLKIAESALAASARTLTSVSKLLGNLSEELKRERTSEDVIDAPQS
jgi:hypothetical protein